MHIVLIMPYPGTAVTSSKLKQNGPSQQRLEEGKNGVGNHGNDKTPQFMPFESSPLHLFLPLSGAFE